MPDKLIHSIERIILSALLSAMILLSCLQIFLRFFFDGGISWADPLLRYMVVWCGLLGAFHAIIDSKHISIDFSHVFSSQFFTQWSAVISSTVSGIVCCFLSYSALLFLQAEKEFGGVFFLAIPGWIWNIPFFVVFIFMALRFFAQTVSRLVVIFRVIK